MRHSQPGLHQFGTSDSAQTGEGGELDCQHNMLPNCTHSMNLYGGIKPEDGRQGEAALNTHLHSNNNIQKNVEKRRHTADLQPSAPLHPPLTLAPAAFYIPQSHSKETRRCLWGQNALCCSQTLAMRWHMRLSQPPHKPTQETPVFLVLFPLPISPSAEPKAKVIPVKVLGRRACRLGLILIIGATGLLRRRD